MESSHLDTNGIDRSAAYTVWGMKLQRLYKDIRKELYGERGSIDGKQLNVPLFRINLKRWGEWNPSTRTISLCEDLFLRFEWGAVEHVLRHEMAHQIITEVWDFDYCGHVHGAAFVRACKLLNISSERCTPETLLMGFTGDDKLPIVDKVRKLLVKGNDSAATDGESKVFLKKAHELMAHHSIDMQIICGEDRLFIPRPVGPLYKHYPSWESHLSKLVEEYYGVERIIMPVYIDGIRYQHMTFFGTPSQLDVAEYIYNAILNIGEILYRQFLSKRKAEHQVMINDWYADCQKKNEQRRLDPTARVYFNNKPKQRKASKGAFMGGLIRGYKDVLAKKHQEVLERIEREEGESKSLLLLDDPMLNEAYHKQYPNIRTFSTNGSYGAGHSEGLTAGRNMRIRTGVAPGGIDNRKLIGS